MDKLREIMEQKERELARVIELCERRIKAAPEGTLRIADRGGIRQYYHRTDPKDTKGKYIPQKQREIVIDLAQKDYDKKLVAELKKEIAVLQKAIENYHPENIEKIYEQLHKNRKELIQPIWVSNEEYVKAWNAVAYEKKGFAKETPEYYTAKGEHVRSKSEIIIADTLYRKGIPYRYEYPIRLNGMGMIYPDFYCLNVRTREEYIWEHFGMMDYENYVNKAMVRIEKYILNGYCFGKNLIATFESQEHPISTKVIEKNIEQYLL